MKQTDSETTLARYWPLAVGTLIVLMTPTLLILHPPEVEGEIEPLVEIVQPIPIDGAVEPARLPDRDEKPLHSVAEVVEMAETDLPEIPPEPESSGKAASELEIRTADWRYVGSIISGKKSVAMIERLEYPDKKNHVALGESLEGVAVEVIASSSMRLSFDGESRDLMLTQGPAFDTADVLIPEEILEEPEILAAVVFAQTLGKYVAEEPDFSPIEAEVEPAGESLHELMDALSGLGNLVPPIEGESMEEWGEAAADEMGSNPEQSLDPSQHPLTEEARLSLLGYDRLMGQ